MVKCLASAAQQAIHPVRICICLSATLRINRLIPTVGKAAAQIRGRSTRKNPYGWRIHRSFIMARRSIHRAIRSIIRPSPPPASSWTTALPTLLKLPTDAGTTSPPVAHRAASCVSSDRAPARPPVPRNGISRRVQAVGCIRCMCASPPFEPQPKARSIPFITRASPIRWCSTSLFSRTSITLQMDGFISADTISMVREANTLNSQIGLRMNLPACRVYTSVWMQSDSSFRELRLRPHPVLLLSLRQPRLL